MPFNHRKPHPGGRVLPPHRLLLGVGLLCVALAALAAQPVQAQNILPVANPPLSTLVKFDNRDYEITHADWVSLEPRSQATVRKIGYGTVREVNVATTDTGTYSSDGMVSPHIRYPGISVRPLPAEGGAGGSALLYGGGGLRIADSLAPGGSSIWILSRAGNGAAVLNTLTGDGVRTCVAQASILSCHWPR